MALTSVLCRAPCARPAVSRHSATLIRAAVPVSRPRAPLRPVAALPGADALQLDHSVKEELPQWLTLAGYAVTFALNQAKVASFSLTMNHIATVLTCYTLVWGGLALADAGTRTQFDAIGGAVGPVFLAINALNGFGTLTAFETAAFLFGTLMTDRLPSFKYSRYAWLATLAAATYKGFAAQWLVGAFGLSALWRLYQQISSSEGKVDAKNVRYQDVAFAALAAWAFYKQAEPTVALYMMVAHIVTSAVGA